MGRNQQKKEIEQHLRSAMDVLTPDIFGKLDLSVPQQKPEVNHGQEKIITLQRRIRGMAVAAAACLCLVTAGGGAWHYQYQNRQIDSVIGIDVNPSVELSISRKNRILKAEPLNQDAEAIMADMDLKGVELNVAVNAVIGSMVTHGYLDDLDNAILVTVSNDSVRKASALRSSVVEDIEQTLQENQVNAVVYDQQVIEEDEVRSLADTYGISYGKAYFLKELINQNQNLTKDDMKRLSTMNMEEIAREITKNSLALGAFADEAKTSQTRENTETPGNVEEPAGEASEEVLEENGEETGSGAEMEASEVLPEKTETAAGAHSESEASADSQTEPETEEKIRQGRVKIDYVDYEEDRIYIYFEDYVRWKNPTVSVRDEEGNSYAALIGETESDACIVETKGLEGGKTYSFVLGGIARKGDSTATTVKGYFDTPEIADELKTSEADKKDSGDAKEDAGGKNKETADTNADINASTNASTNTNADTSANGDTQQPWKQPQKQETGTGSGSGSDEKSSTAETEKEDPGKRDSQTGEENGSIKNDIE